MGEQNNSTEEVLPTAYKYVSQAERDALKDKISIDGWVDGSLYLDELAALNRRNKEELERCKSVHDCKNKRSEKPHTCPFRVDVDDNTKYKCYCCKDCQGECCDDI